MLNFKAVKKALSVVKVNVGEWNSKNKIRRPRKILTVTKSIMYHIIFQCKQSAVY